ncbi:AAA family ATPase, partial [Mycobacterium heidelbergense]|uniref:AAA family ATPase n=1 Tax=Mycobacterium heidelbergense TaxID=53376 RepID=UPI003557D381
MIAEVLFGFGVITRPEVTEITAHDITRDDPSHSAARMKTVCDDARGGVLFLDEAHQLAPHTDNPSLGGDALTTLQTYVADYPGELVVILAGHPTPMQNFLTTHAGLAGRFPHTVAFT